MVAVVADRAVVVVAVEVGAAAGKSFVAGLH